jgi:hypothetical protein
MNEPSSSSRLPTRTGLALVVLTLLIAVLVIVSVRRSRQDEALLRAL